MGGGRYKSWRGVLAEQQCTGVGWGGWVVVVVVEEGWMGEWVGWLGECPMLPVDPLRVLERDRDLADMTL